uniref:Uncharacterized protein n=1 Tax=Sphaerodactylus townsendi TaxID=933632 RepID=A0ACB8EGR2_9SAUR
MGKGKLWAQELAELNRNFFTSNREDEWILIDLLKDGHMMPLTDEAKAMETWKNIARAGNGYISDQAAQSLHWSQLTIYFEEIKQDFPNIDVVLVGDFNVRVDNNLVLINEKRLNAINLEWNKLIQDYLVAY